MEKAQEERNRFVTEHLALVVHIAKQFKRRLPQHIDLNELISEGFIGLIDAANRYDPHLGASSQQYAKIRIQGAMFDFLRKESSIPKESAKILAQWEATKNTLHHQHPGKIVTETLIAQTSGIPLEAYHAARVKMNATKPFVPENTNSDDDFNLIESLPDTSNATPELLLEKADAARDLHRWIRRLPRQERMVLEAMLNKKSMKEIADDLKLNDSRASQIKNSAIARLKTKMRK